jgi:hypothetical protein
MIRKSSKQHGVAAVAPTATAIWAHIIDTDRTSLSPEVARYILKLDFRKSDHRQMDRLSRKASKGTLTEAERAELEEYVRVGHQLAMMHSKARQSLKRHGQGS